MKLNIKKQKKVADIQPFNCTEQIWWVSPSCPQVICYELGIQWRLNFSPPSSSPQFGYLLFSGYLLLTNYPRFSDIKQSLFYFAFRFCGSEIQTGHSRIGLALLHNIWERSWEGSSGWERHDWIELESSEGFLAPMSGAWVGISLSLSERQCWLEHVHMSCPCGFNFF